MFMFENQEVELVATEFKSGNLGLMLVTPNAEEYVLGLSLDSHKFWGSDFVTVQMYSKALNFLMKNELISGVAVGKEKIMRNGNLTEVATFVATKKLLKYLSLECVA